MIDRSRSTRLNPRHWSCLGIKFHGGPNDTLRINIGLAVLICVLLAAIATFQKGLTRWQRSRIAVFLLDKMRVMTKLGKLTNRLTIAKLSYLRPKQDSFNQGVLRTLGTANWNSILSRHSFLAGNYRRPREHEAHGHLWPIVKCRINPRF